MYKRGILLMLSLLSVSLLSLTVSIGNVATADAASLGVSPASDFAGQPFQISGSGFASKETINLWVTDPQGTVSALPSISSDSMGNIAFTYHSHGPLAGRWAVTFHGMSSGIEQYVYFSLVDFVKGGNASIELGPNHGNITNLIEVHGYNFSPNERFTYAFTAPNGTVYHGNTLHRIFHRGSLVFHKVTPADIKGVWTLTVTGLFSGRQASATFTLEK